MKAKTCRLILLLAAAAMLTASCSKSRNYYYPVPGPTVEVPGPTTEVPAEPAPLTIESIVEAHNRDLIKRGEHPLMPGLSCSLYDISKKRPDKIKGSFKKYHVWDFTLLSSFNQEDTDASVGLNVLPEPFKSTYTSWFILDCRGYLVSLESGYFNFSLTSDDGSLLYLNNQLIVDNNGKHASRTRASVQFLYTGVNKFRLLYMQASGKQSLILKMNDAVIPVNQFYW